MLACWSSHCLTEVQKTWILGHKKKKWIMSSTSPQCGQFSSSTILICRRYFLLCSFVSLVVRKILPHTLFHYSLSWTCVECPILVHLWKATLTIFFADSRRLYVFLGDKFLMSSVPWFGNWSKGPPGKIGGNTQSLERACLQARGILSLIANISRNVDLTPCFSWTSMCDKSLPSVGWQMSCMTRIPFLAQCWLWRGPLAFVIHLLSHMASCRISVSFVG